MIEIRRSTRITLAGVFGAGAFYALVVLLEGRWMDPSVIIAIVVELLLVWTAVTRPPVNKTEMALVTGGTIVYLIVSIAYGFFTEITIMTLFGVLIYLTVMSVPKFPLTKRAIATGLAVGVVMTFLGIYLFLKIGIVYFVGAEMLGAIVLGIKGKYTQEENTIVVAIANGSSMIAMGVLIAFPAIEIFKPEVAAELITYPFIAFITGFSAIFGLLLLAPFRERFEQELWPQIIPQAECIISIGMDKSAKMDVGVGLGISAAWVGTTKILETTTGESLATFPNMIKSIMPAASGIPDWIGITNSPLIAAIGFFLGWKRAITLVIGSIASILIWIFLEGAVPIDYGVHLHRPEILYLVLGVFSTVILQDVRSSMKDEPLSMETFDELVQNKTRRGTDETIVIETPHKSSELPRLLRVREELFSLESIKEDIQLILKSPREFMRTKRGQIPIWVAGISMILFMIIGGIMFFIIRPFAGLEIHWLLFVLGAPLVLISAYFTARAISETGMLAGYISDVISIPAILLFRVTFQAITTFLSMLGALQDSAIALLVHLKLGRLTGVRGRDITKAVFIGAMLGTFVGSLITYILYVNYHFGTAIFPAPAAQLFGFLVTSIQGLGKLVLPGMDRELFPGIHPLIQFLYLFAFGGVGFILGKELSRRGYSPMSLAVGMLIPPATSAAMLFGGYIDYRHKKWEKRDSELIPKRIDAAKMKRNKTSRVLSGIVAGEAIVTVIWVMWSAIMLILG